MKETWKKIGLGIVVVICVVLAVVMINKNQAQDSVADVVEDTGKKPVEVNDTISVEDKDESLKEEPALEEEDKYAGLAEEWKKTLAKQLEEENGKIQSISLTQVGQSKVPVMEYIVNKDERDSMYVVSYMDEKDRAQTVIKKEIVNDQYDKAAINSEGKILFSDDDAEYLYTYDPDTTSYQQVYEIKGPFDDAEVYYSVINDCINDVETLFYDEEEYKKKCDEITGNTFNEETKRDATSLSLVYTEADAQKYSVDEFFNNIDIPYIEEDGWKKDYIDFINEHEGANKIIRILVNENTKRPLLDYTVTSSDGNTIDYICYADYADNVQIIVEESVGPTWWVELTPNGNLLVGFSLASGSENTIDTYDQQTDQYHYTYDMYQTYTYSDNCYEINGIMYLEKDYEKKRSELMGNPDYVPLSEQAEWKCEAEGDKGIDIIEFLSGVNCE